MSHSLDSPEARLAARVRAVQAYAALSYDELAARTKIGESTLRRIASPARPRGASLDEQWLIADACGVPRSWLEDDWQEQHPSTEDAHDIGHAMLNREALVRGVGSESERLALLERYVHALLLEQERRHPELAQAESEPPARTRRRQTTSG